MASTRVTLMAGRSVDSLGRLAIVGASARAAAFSATRAGWKVVTADLFADADLQSVAEATRIENYPEGLADWLAEIDADAWIYTGALENHPDLVDRMAKLKPLWGTPGSALRRIRDPMLLQRSCADAGLRFPETRSSPQGLSRDGTWLLKTYRGSNGRGVSRLEESAGEPGYAQRFVAGTPYAAAFVACQNGAKLLGVTQQRVGDPQLHAERFAYCGSQIAPDLKDSTRAILQRLGDSLVTHFSLIGLFGVDLIIEGEAVWPLEVNPRYTASLEVIESLHSVEGVERHAVLFGAENFPRATRHDKRPAPRRPVAWKAILFARQAAQVSESFTQWALALPAEGTQWRVADIPNSGVALTAGEPVATLLASHSDVALQPAVAEVERRLYDQAP